PPSRRQAPPSTAHQAPAQAGSAKAGARTVTPPAAETCGETPNPNCKLEAPNKRQISNLKFQICLLRFVWDSELEVEIFLFASTLRARHARPSPSVPARLSRLGGLCRDQIQARSRRRPADLRPPRHRRRRFHHQS